MGLELFLKDVCYFDKEVEGRASWLGRSKIGKNNVAGVTEVSMCEAYQEDEIEKSLGEW